MGALLFHDINWPFISSFPDCYAAEFGELEVSPENQGAVPLEHLITCVPGVNIATAQNGIKVVKWIHNKPPPPNTGRCRVFGPLSPIRGERRLLAFILNKYTGPWVSPLIFHKRLSTSKVQRFGRTKFFESISINYVKKFKTQIPQ